MIKPFLFWKELANCSFETVRNLFCWGKGVHSVKNIQFYLLFMWPGKKLGLLFNSLFQSWLPLVVSTDWRVRLGANWHGSEDPFGRMIIKTWMIRWDLELLDYLRRSEESFLRLIKRISWVPKRRCHQEEAACPGAWSTALGPQTSSDKHIVTHRMCLGTVV